MIYPFLLIILHSLLEVLLKWMTKITKHFYFIEFQILGAKNPKVQPSGKGKDLIRKYVIKLE